MNKYDDMMKTITLNLKKEFIKSDWWSEVQEDVRTRLEWVVDHIGEVGILFGNAYITLFRWEHQRRKTEGEAVANNSMAGWAATMLGVKITEETYQCGVLPTRAVLNLYDYTQPNDADVTACMFLCNKIEQLERAGVLSLIQSPKTITEEVAAVFGKSKPAKKKVVPDSVSEESITWDFDEE